MRKVISVFLIMFLCSTLFFVNNPVLVSAADSIFFKQTDDVELNTLLSDFETGTDGWAAGSNVLSFSSESTIANGPEKAYKGGYCGEVISTVCPGTSWRTIYKDFSTPVDLSKTPYFAGAVNTYGIGQSYTDFEVRVTFYSGTNSIHATFQSDLAVKSDRWTPIFVNLSNWTYINSLTKIEIAFRSSAYASNWQANHQIDYLGFSSSEGWEFNKDGDFEGWSFGNNLTGRVSGGYLNATVAGVDPHIYGNNDFIADAAYSKYLTVRVKNGTPGTQGRLYWITNLDGTFSESKSIPFSITANDSAYRTIGVDLSGISTWANKITRLRLDIPDNSSNGDISIGYVKLNTYPEDVYYGGGVNSIEATVSNILVNGSVNCTSQKTIDLIELQPYEQYNFAAAYAPVATLTVTPSGGIANFQFNIARNYNSKDRTYSKYIVIVNDTVKKKLDVEKYVTVFPSSENNYSYPTVNSIKGLQVQMVDDAQKLGVRNAALNLTVNSLFYLDGSNLADTIQYVMDGETFYIKKGYIEDFDKSVKSLSDEGVIVTLIVLMQDEVDSATPNKYIIHPDHTDGKPIYAFNTTDEMGTKYFKAAMEFIVLRYTRADQAYGRAVNYIIGNEVDMGIDWYNMGEKEMCDFIDQYARTIRIANTAAKKIYSNARVFVSLTHNWNMRGVANDWQYYKGRDIVDGFNARILEQGNIPWNIAYHPYPEDLGDPRIWEDTSTIDSFDTPRINFKNLHILSNYINRPNYYYNGAMRRIILSEEGFHSLTNNTADQRVQAAAYAYSYYKAKFTYGIDAFILHRHVDHRDEGGLNLGIWMRDTSKTIGNAPGTPKYLYDVFKKIDTSESESVTEFAKSIIGISSWSQVITGWDNTKLADQTLPATFSISKLSSISPTVNVSNFEGSDNGWKPSDYCISAQRVSGMANLPGTAYEGAYMLKGTMVGSNQAEPDYSGGASAEAGLVKTYTTPINATAAPKFQIAVNSYGGCPGATAYYCTIRLYSGTNIAEGKVQVTPDTWNKLQMDISTWEYKSSIDKIKIWFSTDSKAIWNGEYQIDYAGFRS